jgi:Asp-tRNA(Asn)/Glu-tRNA(Gln) amidotransferase A subunit family amidase
MTDTADAIRALDAPSLRARLADGSLSAEAVAEAYLARIAAREPEIRAFVWHDPAHVRARARALDARRAAGAPLGALHGIPVAVKDVIDTAGIPTENGAQRDRGRVPARNAHVVARLLAEGAILMGKSVTTELAFLHPGPTRNPRAPGHTPGGSSSGSAAAVADGMVLAAIGTQTGGSVIRPASFCGVVGFKPSFGAIGRSGVLLQSHTLDTVGVFARSPAEAAMLGDALIGPDAGDAQSIDRPAPRLAATLAGGVARAPVLALMRMTGWERADPRMREGIEALAGRLGVEVFEADLPPTLACAQDLRGQINLAEMAHYYAAYGGAAADLLGAPTREAIAAGAAISAPDYIAALGAGAEIAAELAPVFARADAILCPSALGPPPEGLGNTGDSIFNGPWTLLGAPAVSLPLLETAEGLPMGVQIVGAPGDDARLLRTADWLMARAARG